MTDDKEKKLYFAMAKITIAGLWYYSFIIGLGFTCGASAFVLLGLLIDKIMF